MLDEFAKSNFSKQIAENFPHLKYPAVVKAKVTAMSKFSEKTWQYNVKPLRQDLSNADFPEIPSIKSHIEVEAGVGGVVAIALMYGGFDPIIIDEVIE